MKKYYLRTQFYTEEEFYGHKYWDYIVHDFDKKEQIHLTRAELFKSGKTDYYNLYYEKLNDTITPEKLHEQTIQKHDKRKGFNFKEISRDEYYKEFEKYKEFINSHTGL